MIYCIRLKAQVETNLRIMLISRLGVNGHQQTINETQRQFAEHTQNISLIHVDMRQVISSVVAFNGNSTTVDQLVDVRSTNSLCSYLHSK